MKLRSALVLLLVISSIATLVEAKGGKGGNSSYSAPNAGYGTGANSKSHSVDGYIKRDGTYVAPHTKTNPNGKFEDNYGTKPNFNPYTGQEGKRVSPPNK